MFNKDFIRRVVKLSAIMYILSLLFSWPVARFFGSTIDRYAGHSLFLSRIDRGFDPLFFSDFFTNTASSLRLLPSIIFPLVLGYLLLHILAGAGVMNAFAQEDRPVREAFGSGAFRYGPHFGGIFVIFLPLYALMAGLIVAVFSLIRMMIPEHTSEMFPIYYHAVEYFFVLIGLSYCHTVHQIAKANLILNGGGIFRSFSKVWHQGFTFVRGMFGRNLLFLLAGGIVGLIIPVFLPAGSHDFLHTLIITQASVFALIALRTSASGMFLVLCRRTSAPPEVVLQVSPPEVPAQPDLQLQTDSTETGQEI